MCMRMCDRMCKMLVMKQVLWGFEAMCADVGGVVLIHMSSTCIYVFSCVPLFGWPVSRLCCVAKTLNLTVLVSGNFSTIFFP